MKTNRPAPRAAGAALTLAVALLGAACASGSGAAPATPGTSVTASASRAAVVPGRLSAVAFTGPRRGYGLFQRSLGSRCQYQVARTADGGARFTGLTAVITWPCARPSPVASLAADTSGDVFLYGPRLYVSHDSAATWAPARLAGSDGQHVVAVAAAGPRTAWLVTARCGRPGGGLARCALGVLRSGDGGRSWTAAQPSAAAFRAVSVAASGQTWLVPAGPRSAYVLAMPAVNSHGRANRVPLWVTRDGGASWSRRSAPCGTAAVYAAAAVAPDGTLFVACAGEAGAGSQAKSVARSADGGRTWTLHAWCPRRVLGCPPMSMGYLGAIAAPTGRDVFLAGGRSSLLVSRDGGASWNPVRPLLGDSGGGTFAIVFFGPRDGLVLGDDPAHNELPTIWHTGDGGAHWRAVHPVVR